MNKTSCFPLLSQPAGDSGGGYLFSPFSEQMLDPQWVQVWTIFFWSKEIQLFFCTVVWGLHLSYSLSHISKGGIFYDLTLIITKNVVSKS